MPLLLALLAAILAGWPAGSWAADSLVDLGQNRPVPREDQAVVGGQHAVLVSVNSTGGYGLWENGTVVIPSAPASDPTATFTPASINSLGVVVGVARTGSAHYVPAYLASATSTSFVEISESGLTVAGQSANFAELSYIDAGGEAVGQMGDSAGDTAGLYVPASGGVPAGQPQVISTLGSTAVGTLYGISAGYEMGFADNGANSTEFLYNRSSGDVTQTNLAGLGQVFPFADNGTLAGYVPQAGPHADVDLVPPGGSDVLLSQGGEVLGVNDSRNSVGANTTSDGIEWSSSGAETEVSSLFPASADASSISAEGIDNSNDIAGFGSYNGNQNEGFLLNGQPLFRRW